MCQRQQPPSLTPATHTLNSHPDPPMPRPVCFMQPASCTPAAFKSASIHHPRAQVSRHRPLPPCIRCAARHTTTVAEQQGPGVRSVRFQATHLVTERNSKAIASPRALPPQPSKRQWRPRTAPNARAPRQRGTVEHGGVRCEKANQTRRSERCAVDVKLNPLATERPKSPRIVNPIADASDSPVSHAEVWKGLARVPRRPFVRALKATIPCPTHDTNWQPPVAARCAPFTSTFH